MTAPLVFPLMVGGQEFAPGRFAKGSRSPAGLNDDITFVQLEPGRIIVPGFKVVKLRGPREPRTFLMGEIIDDVEHLTTYIETPIDLCAPGMMFFDSELPVRLIPGDDRTVHIHLPEGFGVVPRYTLVQFTRSYWRHFVAGDIWRGERWLHSVMEVAMPRHHPRRSRVR